jgi:hypothetical protein
MTLRCRRMLGLEQSAQLRQLNALWVLRAREGRQESRRLCQHTRALQARYQHWRQRYFLVACTWCQKHLGWQYLAKNPYLDPPFVGRPPISHGVCPTCFETQLRELHQGKSSGGFSM